jgi:ribonuclease P protein component
LSKSRLKLDEQTKDALFTHGARWRENSLSATFDFFGSDQSLTAVITPKAVLAKATARNALRRKFFIALKPFLGQFKQLRLVLRIESARLSALSSSELQALLEKLFTAIKNKHG